ncbi:MAG TPA: hypothetical protein VGR62_02945 [Candidatus Binatia bacterium]|jgi:hypothetical protein|nr:hypothetical protein [Candidatus Binatia bacterium]
MRALLLVLLLTAGLVRADDAPVAVRAWSEPDSVTIGQQFRYVVEVTTTPGVEVVLAQPTEKLGPFDILDFGTDKPVQKDGRTVVTRWYRLAGWATGHQLITSPPVQYRVPGQELVTATPDDVGVTVTSLLDGTDVATADIRPIRQPLDFPTNWLPYWLAAGVVAVLAGIVLLVRWLRARRRRAEHVAPPPPPHVVALAALEALRARHLPQQGAFKEYYSALSIIVRTYLEQRFELRAPEMTTEEFLAVTARGGRLDRAHRSLLGQFLTESDMVKFARYVPALSDADRAEAAAQRFINDTTPRIAPEDTRAAG